MGWEGPEETFIWITPGFWRLREQDTEVIMANEDLFYKLRYSGVCMRIGNLAV